MRRRTSWMDDPAQLRGKVSEYDKAALRCHDKGQHHLAGAWKMKALVLLQRAQRIEAARRDA